MATRREKVVLDLQDDFTPGMAKAAAITAALNRELDNLSGKSVQADRSTQVFVRNLGNMSREARGADRSINQLTGRLRLFADIAATLGPSLVPIGGVAIAGIGGLANQLGLAAVAGGVLVGSLQGVGDALGAMNDAQLDPTAANLKEAEEALKRLSPAARDFAREAFALKPALVALRDIGAEALMPGLTESLESIEELGPRVGSLMQSIGGVLGDIASDSAESISSERWADFFRFIEAEGPPTLEALATTVGSLSHGLSELWEAFAPLNSDFSDWLRRVAEDFDGWASGLSQTEGFRDFIDYVRETGPQVAETFGALANAAVQLVQATAPLGGPVLAAIEGVADAFSAIADSSIGTPLATAAAALALWNRTLAVTASLNARTTAGGGIFGAIGARQAGMSGSLAAVRKDVADLGATWATAGARTAREQQRMADSAKSLRTNLGGLAGETARAAAPLAGLGIVATGAADGIGLTNTVSFALMGSILPGLGTALGAGAGLFMDWRASVEAAEQQAEAFRTSLESMSLTELNAGLAEAQRLLTGLDSDSMGAGLVRDRIGEIETQIDATKRLATEQEHAERAAAMTYAEEKGYHADLATWRSRSVEDIKAIADAYAASREAAHDTAREFVNLGDGVDDAKVSMSQWLKQLENQAAALNNFMDNARRASKRGLQDGLIADLQAAGPVGAMRMRQLANATDEEIARANRAWKRGQRAMQDYVDFKVPPKRLDVETGPGMRNIEALEARLRAIKDEDVFINVRQINSADTQLGPRTRSADGGTVPKTGKPYADRHLYLLADGEEVISNRHGQADRHRPLLKAINGGLAEGGTTGRKDGKRKSGAFFYSPDNTDALQAAIDRLAMVQQDQTDALESSTRQQEFWASKMSDLAQATVSGFNTGLFDRDSDVWSAGAGGGPIANLLGDIAGLNERAGLQSQLAGMGLSGDTLAALLSQGTNADISGLIQSGQVGQFADLYAQRAALQGSVGAGANLAAGFTAQAAAAAAESAAMRAAQQETILEIVKLNGKLERTAAAVERWEANGPERTGDAAGRAVRGAAVEERRDSHAGRRP